MSMCHVNSNGRNVGATPCGRSLSHGGHNMNLATRRLGQSELEITSVGIGTAPIGSTSRWRIYWGPQSESEAIRAIDAALDLGVNWIDTAPFYGWGQAEQIVGKALRGKRDSVFVFTKCGTLPL